MGEHEAHLIIEGIRIFIRAEITGPFSPLRPGVTQTVEYLPHIILSAGYTGLERHSGLSKVLLGRDVRGDLGPTGRHGHIILSEDELSF